MPTRRHLSVRPVTCEDEMAAIPAAITATNKEKKREKVPGGRSGGTECEERLQDLRDQFRGKNEKHCDVLGQLQEKVLAAKAKVLVDLEFSDFRNYSAELHGELIRCGYWDMLRRKVDVSFG
jgi:hypothetical protein